MILRLLFSIVIIQFPNFAHGCTVTNSPSTEQMVPTSIYADQDGSSIVYTVASSSPGTEYSTTGKSIQTLRNETQQCPKECIRRLNAFKDPNFGNVFLTRNGVTIAEGAPFGYTQQNGSSPIICAAKQGFCGANAPIYRYYKFSISGIVHAYAFSSNASLPGYAPEMEPLCYGWTNVEGNMTQKENGPLSSPVKRDELVTTCNSQLTVPNDKLLELKEYDNKKFGPMRDHYMTSLQQSQIGNDYQYVSTIGKVLREPSACGCTVELTQSVDSSGGIIGHIDHKLAIKGREQNRIFESYVPIGETVFCARQKNACGATLPLYKHFQFLESDTRYTTTGRGPVFSYLYPETPLCYIWATNYTTSVTNNAPPFGSTPNTTVSMENTVTSTSKRITTVTTANTVTSAAQGMNRSAVPSTVTKTPTTVLTSVNTVATVTTAAQGINRTDVPTTATNKPTTVVTSKGTVTTITKKATTNAVTEETIERKTIAPEQATLGTVTSNTVLMHTTKAMKNSSLSTNRPGSGESSEIGESTARSTVTSKVVSMKTTEKDESGESKTTVTTNKPTIPESSTVTTVSTKSSEGTTKTSTTTGTSTVSDRNVTSLGGQNQTSSVSVSTPTLSTSTTTTTKTTSTSSILTTNTTRKEENNDKSTSTSGTKASTTSSLASLLTTVKNPDPKVTSPSPSSSTTKTTASATSSTTTRSGPESSTSQTNKTVTSSNSSTTMTTVSTTTTSKSSSISPTSRKTTTGVPTSTPAASTTSLKTTPMINQTATQKISGSSDTPISTLSTTTPVSSTPIPKMNGTVSLELPSNSTKGSDSLGAILKKFASILD